MHRKLTPLLIVLNLAALILVGYIARFALREPVHFDDSFMFLRYALHLRQGLGISWNPDGVHTGGMTSLGWFLIVIPLSFFPLAYGQPLAVGSLVIGITGIALLARQVARLSVTPHLRRFGLVFPALTLLLAGTPFFRRNMLSGMDTMLSFTVDVALCCAVWNWCRGQGGNYQRSAGIVGLLAALAVITRPENGILAVGTPLLAALLLIQERIYGDNRKPRQEALRAAATFTVVLAGCLIAYKFYFHAWLPLGFHIKSQHAYRGYVGAIHWIPEHYLGKFLLLALPILTFPVLCADRISLRVAITFLAPVAATFAYLETVTQIMGYDARYYVPFLAPVLVAAFWMADHTLEFKRQRQLRQRLPAIAAIVVVLIAVALVSWRPLNRWSQRRLMVAAYPAPVLTTRATSSLPWRPGYALNRLLVMEVIQPLPSGSVIAASEVGLLGAAAPDIAIIDLAGLNDNETAWHGFNMQRLLDRKPLLIWFPHTDYTWQRQEMLCTPHLLDAYTVIGGNAFNYSIAIRREIPLQAQLMRNLGKAFEQAYPGSVMQDYVVSSIQCQGKETTPPVAPPQIP